MKSLISISLSVFMLFSTVGMAKTTHFCMGHEMKSEIGFGEKHLDCGMSMPMEHSENEAEENPDTSSCCENITEHLQVDDDVQLKKLDFKLDLNFSIALVQIFIFGIDSYSSEIHKVGFYLPPPPTQDLHVLYESFLI